MAKNTKVSIYSQKDHKRFFDTLISNKDFRKFHDENVVGVNPDDYFNFKDYQISLLSEYDKKGIRLSESKVGLTSIEYYKNNKDRPDFSLNNVLVFDFETTDLKGWAVSVALVAYDINKDKIVNQFYELINPKCKIPKEATEVHKITDSMVKDKPYFDSFIPEITKRIEWADLVVGHNVDFDLSVMIREYQTAHKYSKIVDLPKFDTMKEGKRIINAKDVKGKIKDPRLEEAVSFYELDHLKDGMYHNALTDTTMTAEVFKRMFVHS